MSQPRVLVEVGIDAQRGRLPAAAESTEGEEKRKVCDMGLPARGMTEEELLRDQEGGWGCRHLVCPCECVHMCVSTCGHSQSEWAVFGLRMCLLGLTAPPLLL